MHASAPASQPATFTHDAATGEANSAAAVAEATGLGGAAAEQTAAPASVAQLTAAPGAAAPGAAAPGAAASGTAASESPHAEESAPPESSTAGEERDAQAREIALQEESDARRALTEAMPGFKARRRECVPGDGDCMFTAVAAAAGLTNAHLLRLAAVAFLRCNPTRVLPNTLALTLEDWTTAVNGITFHETLRGFESNSEPGAYMLATLATVVGRPITVVKFGWEEATYLPEGASLHMVWNPAEVNPDHLALLYTGTHYDALVLDGAPAVQATLTLASIVGYLPKDNVERVVGV